MGMDVFVEWHCHTPGTQLSRLRDSSQDMSIVRTMVGV
jgi:hypothetical protein